MMSSNTVRENSVTYYNLNIEVMFENDIFVPVSFPDNQLLMEEEGFNNNSQLITSDKLYDEYGDSAYLVRRSWLNKVIGKEQRDDDK